MVDSSTGSVELLCQMGRAVSPLRYFGFRGCCSSTCFLTSDIHTSRSCLRSSHAPCSKAPSFDGLAACVASFNAPSVNASYINAPAVKIFFSGAPAANALAFNAPSSTAPSFKGEFSHRRFLYRACRIVWCWTAPSVLVPSPRRHHEYGRSYEPILLDSTTLAVSAVLLRRETAVPDRSRRVLSHPALIDIVLFPAVPRDQKSCSILLETPCM